MSDMGAGTPAIPPEPSGFDQTTQAGSSNQPVPDYSELGQGFLKDVDPRDLPVVQKYLKPWDQRVNQRFREIHSEYQPYKQLGASVEDIQVALQVAQLLDANPQYVYQELGNRLGHGGQQVTPNVPQNGAGANGAGQTSNPAYEGLPEPFVAEFNQMREIITAIGNQFVQQKQMTEQQQADQALEKHIGDLHKKYGNFDEDYVTAKMAYQNMSGDDAVKAYQQLVQNALNSQASISRPVPPILGGGGAVPAGVDASHLSRKDSRALMAQMLAKAANAAQ